MLTWTWFYKDEKWIHKAIELYVHNLHKEKRISSTITNINEVISNLKENIQFSEYMNKQVELYLFEKQNQLWKPLKEQFKEVELELDLFLRNPDKFYLHYLREKELLEGRLQAVVEFRKGLNFKAYLDSQLDVWMLRHREENRPFRVVMEEALNHFKRDYAFSIYLDSQIHWYLNHTEDGKLFSKSFLYTEWEASIYGLESDDLDWWNGLKYWSVKEFSITDWIFTSNINFFIFSLLIVNLIWFMWFFSGIRENRHMKR